MVSLTFGRRRRFHQLYAAPTTFPVMLGLVQDRLTLDRTPKLIVGQESTLFVGAVSVFRVRTLNGVAHFWSCLG